MARTKNTTKKKESPQTTKKRKLENAECYGNERKKIKLDIDDEESSNSEESSSSAVTSSTSEESSSSDDDEEEDDDMTTAIESVKDILRSTHYSRSEILEFSKTLQKMVENAQQKVQELEYRENANKLFFKSFKNNMGFKRLAQYFNTKILEFSKTMIKAFRYYKTKKWEEWDYGHCTHYVDYSVDIALKTNIIHQKYDEKMYNLLGKYINNISEISRIISGYTNNGYRWYRMEFTDQTDADGEQDWKDFAFGILREVDYNIDDYFYDNKFYKEEKEKPGAGKFVKFSSMRKELNCNLMKKMNDMQLAQFIIAVASIIFDFEGFQDNEQWIVQHHR